MLVSALTLIGNFSPARADDVSVTIDWSSIRDVGNGAVYLNVCGHEGNVNSDGTCRNIDVANSNVTTNQSQSFTLGLDDQRTYQICIFADNTSAGNGRQFRCETLRPTRPQRVLLVFSDAFILPETSSTVTSTSGPQSFGGGWAEASAELSRTGLLTVQTHARSDSCFEATRGRALIIGYDSRGRDVFVSNYFNMSTASAPCDLFYSRGDETRDTFTQRINSDLAPYVASLRVMVDQRGGPSRRDQIRQNIAEACGTYDDLPPAARAAIGAETGFSGCNS